MFVSTPRVHVRPQCPPPCVPWCPPVSHRVHVRPLLSESLRHYLLPFLSLCPPHRVRVSPPCPCPPVPPVSLCPSVCGHPLACPSMSILPNPCPSMTIVSPSPRVTAPLSPPHRVRVHPVTSVSLCVPRVPPCPPSHIHPFMAVSTLSCPCPCFSGPCPPCHLSTPCIPRVRVHPSCPSVSPGVTALLTHLLVSMIPRVSPSLDAHPPRVLAPPCPPPSCPCPSMPPLACVPRVRAPSSPP